MTRIPTDGPERWARVSELLDAAFERTVEDRSAFLDEACAGDAELRQELEELLRVERHAPSFLERGALRLAERAFLSEASGKPHPDRVGSYRLLRELGRGGMGTVYLADRVDGAFDHTVAVKLVNSDIDFPAVERRFRYERQVLANLQHPHIARLLDGGATPDGMLYLIMEYVDGRNILDHCAHMRADLRERLRLFSCACEAVQHAHHALVVHRDLKPSNILVTDGGHVKLLDFGIAKLLDEGSRTDPGPVTRLGIQPMTPEYASPEQIRGDAVTTASDVYSLGVVLYELLTGTRPYATEHRSPAELERVVSDRVPPRPSSVVATKRRIANASSTRRQGSHGGRTWDPGGQVATGITRDLDAIVLRALKKEPTERYPSATELLEDIRRFLGGFPVSARDDSARYRASRFVGRNRIAVSLATMMVLSLVGGMIGTSWQARLAARERDARRLEAERAQATAEFAVGLFEAVDPAEAQGRPVTVRDLVGRGLGRVAELAGQPARQAMFMDVMARVSESVGDFETADSLYREALALKERHLGSADPAVAESLLGLGGSLLMQNRLDEAERALDRAQQIQIAAFGASDPRTLAYRSRLGLAHHTLANRERAETLLRDVISRADDPALENHPAILDARVNLARVLDFYGDHEQAEGHLRAVLERREADLGLDHPETAAGAFTLARNLTNQGRLQEAAVQYRRAHEVYERVYGPTNVYTAMSIYGLATVQHRSGALAEAEQGYRTAARLYAAQPSSREWEAYARVALGQVLVARSQPEEAERELNQGLELYLAAPVVDGSQIAVAWSWLGRALTQLGRLSEAEHLLLSAHDTLATREHLARQAADAARHLAALYRAWNRAEEALRWENRISEAEREPGG